MPDSSVISTFSNTGIKKPTAICPCCNKPQKVSKDRGVAVFETHYTTLARTRICEGSGRPVPERM